MLNFGTTKCGALALKGGNHRREEYDRTFARLLKGWKPQELYVIVDARDESKKIIQKTWSDVMVSDASTELVETNDYRSR